MNGNSVALINLLRGWPNPGLLPHVQIKAAADRALSDPKVFVPGLLYGPDEGYGPLRDQLALWLTEFYNHKEAIRAERICITGGASQNLGCLLQVYTDPVYTRNIWMISPTYFKACPIFEDAGFGGRLRSIPEDDQGIDLDFLRKGLQQSEREAAAKGNMKPVRD
jgi:DNA-binding transcriptional MocR family regulator